MVVAEFNSRDAVIAGGRRDHHFLLLFRARGQQSLKAALAGRGQQVDQVFRPLLARNGLQKIADDALNHALDKALVAGWDLFRECRIDLLEPIDRFHEVAVDIDDAHWCLPNCL